MERAQHDRPFRRKPLSQACVRPWMPCSSPALDASMPDRGTQRAGTTEGRRGRVRALVVKRV